MQSVDNELLYPGVAWQGGTARRGHGHTLGKEESEHERGIKVGITTKQASAVFDIGAMLQGSVGNGMRNLRTIINETARPACFVPQVQKCQIPGQFCVGSAKESKCA